jgi:ribonuclease HI
MTPRAPGRSLAMTLLWHGVPTADVENAPAIMYSKMVWKAVTRRHEAELRGTTVADLRRAWEAAQNGFQPLVDEIAEARGRDGKVPAAVARAVWRRVRGPVAAAAVTLARVGWRFGGPFTLIDEDGTEHCLTTASPCLVRDLLRDATRNALERAVGVSFAKRSEAFRGRRACLDLAISSSKVGRNNGPHQAAAFRAAACGAVWTATAAKDRGYVTDGKCPLGCDAPDTVHHRTYDCVHTETIVRAAVPRWFWQEAQRAAAGDPFWTTGVFPHPADLAPPPRQDLYCEVEQHQPGPDGSFDPPACTAVKGKAYIDGSCEPSPIRGLARASCALVTCTASGQPIKTLQCPVPRHLPQTSQSAEYLIAAVAFECLRGTTEVIGDCLNVVKAYAAGVHKALAPTRKYAGLVAASFKDPDKRRLGTLRWTKAHRAASGQETADEAADIRGNAAADAAAGQAMALHPALFPSCAQGDGTRAQTRDHR